jgi:hypothetical protein
LHFHYLISEVDDKEPEVDFMTKLGMHAEVSLNHFFTLLGERELEMKIFTTSSYLETAVALFQIKAG